MHILRIFRAVVCANYPCATGEPVELGEYRPHILGRQSPNSRIESISIYSTKLEQHCYRLDLQSIIL